MRRRFVIRPSPTSTNAYSRNTAISLCRITGGPNYSQCEHTHMMMSCRSVGRQLWQMWERYIVQLCKRHMLGNDFVILQPTWECYIFKLVVFIHRHILTVRFLLVSNHNFYVFTARDIVKYLVDTNVRTIDEFNWVAQLRYYWKYDTVGKLDILNWRKLMFHNVIKCIECTLLKIS